MKTEKNGSNDISRRKFIGTSLTLSAGLITVSRSVIGAPAFIRNVGKPDSMINGVQIGAITYSFREQEDQGAEATLKYIVDSGFSAVELMGEPAESFAGIPENPVDRWAFFGLMRKSRSDEGLTDEEKKQMEDMRAQMDSYGKQVSEWRSKVSMDSFIKLKKMFNDAGVSIYAFKPSAFSSRNTDAEMDYGFKAAKALGASHVTLEHPSNDEMTAKLGKMAAKHKVNVGYHGHEQQTPTFWDEALKQSKSNMLNLDIGHFVAAGNPDPIAIINDKYDRIASMHIKDRQTPDNGKGNLPWGEGDTPLPEILQLMRDKKYKFPATAELEYRIPEGSDSVKELQKCLEFCRKALA